MAFASLPAKIASDTLTLTNYNTIRDNFELTAPGLVTTKGDIVAATAANAPARLAVGANGTLLGAASGETTGLKYFITPSVRAYNNAAIDPATGSWVTLTFNAERWDTNDMHSTASNTERLTIPTGGDGIYTIDGGALFDTSGVGGTGAYYGIRVLLGATVIQQIGPIELTMNTHDMGLAISAQYSLAATNYLTLQIYTSVDINILSTANFSPEFGATWLRGAP